MPFTLKSRLALLGGTTCATVLGVVGLGVLPSLGHSEPAPVRTAARMGETTINGATASSASPPSTVAPETTTVEAPRATTRPPTGAMPQTTPAAAPVAVADPAPPATPAASSNLAAGQRTNPTSAEVQAAVAALHQRIPLFAPTGQQLLAFADAVCASFDQGQTQAQVQSTVQQAVSRIQGASLSAADADFAVHTVVALRCPGYLP